MTTNVSTTQSEISSEGYRHNKGGSVVLQQRYSIDDIAIAATDTGIVLPANAKLIDVNVAVDNAPSSQTLISLSSQAADNELVGSFTIGTTADHHYNMADATAVVGDKFYGVGPEDYPVYIRSSRADNDFTAEVIVLYSLAD